MCIYFTPNLYAQETFDKTAMLALIQQTAEQHAATQIDPPDYGELTLSAATLDSRLNYTQCPSPLLSEIPGRQSMTHNVNVLVSCPELGWKVYVPVRIQLTLPLVVATRPLARGEVIGAGDVEVAMREQRFQRGLSYNEPQLVVGAKVKRAINHGDIIQGNDICLVCRNDVVNIIAAGGGLNIVTPGTALGDGLLGEQIKVQNSKSRRIVEGKVTGVGEVSVIF
uniref:flagellar basal body P-ring formation chaperone FlgA n=1 Tax=Thaumasiovibrio occultus TaxID=1891184 RepID=UPI000B34E7DF|nr:flagellar basal body P-ring formation chaperone FlgA [Thaumasiovibrio occultus]